MADNLYHDDFDTDSPICPACDSKMWDNRRSKKNPKAPDYKCKDDGDHVVWLPKAEKSSGGGKANGRAPVNGKGPASLDEMFTLYDRCMGHAVKVSKKLDERGIATDGSATAAICATIFIAAKDRGFSG